MAAGEISPSQKSPDDDDNRYGEGDRVAFKR